ncbi:MAG: DUF4115 domain-containing protein [Bacillota bacterium]|nr:DUF4115 domain-containing protein [Bacillota bacterium]
MLQLTELGNRLKEARLKHGISLEDLQSITKIQKRYLIGIEEGDFSSMPGNFYVRAFIKQYAEAVHLNPEEVFETYKTEIPSAYHQDLPEQLSRVKTRKTLTERNPKVFDVLPKILIAVVIIGVAALIYYLLKENASSHSNQSVNNQNAPVHYTTNTKELNKVQASGKNKKKKSSDHSKDNTAAQTPAPTQQLTLVKSSGTRSTFQLQNTDKFVVKLVSNGKAWVNIKNGSGHSFYSGILDKNGTGSQSVDLSNETSAVLVIGKATDVDIYINDQKMDYALPPAKIVTQFITIQFVPTKK